MIKVSVCDVINFLIFEIKFVEDLLLCIVLKWKKMVKTLSTLAEDVVQYEVWSDRLCDGAIWDSSGGDWSCLEVQSLFVFLRW